MRFWNGPKWWQKWIEMITFEHWTSPRECWCRFRGMKCYPVWYGLKFTSPLPSYYSNMFFSPAAQHFLTLRPGYRDPKWPSSPTPMRQISWPEVCQAKTQDEHHDDKDDDDDNNYANSDDDNANSLSKTMNMNQRQWSIITNQVLKSNLSS